MDMRRMGNTDLICSALGLGTWELGHRYGDIDDAGAAAAMLAALDRGINLVDTAEAYGPYRSELLVGKTLGARRKDVILVTKVGFTFDEAGEITGRCARRDYVLERAEGCLQRLQTDWIDLLLIHWPDHACPLEETIGALEQLKRAGKIRYYGVSNFTVEMMDECRRHGSLAANQVGYNIFDRRMEAHVLPYCQAHTIAFMAYGPLCYGLLTGAFTPETTFAPPDWRSGGQAFKLPLFERDHFLRELRAVDGLRALAERCGRTVPQLAIAWVLGHPAVTVALVGVRNERELQEDIQAAGWRLSDEIRGEIDRILEEAGVPTYADADQAV
jgi:aryl-alcohol dehydrogenase-like predicted oxidoreductase